MINQDCRIKVIDFLKDYPSPTIRTATTMYKGSVVCIKPIKYVCDSELMCHPDTSESLVRLIREGS